MLRIGVLCPADIAGRHFLPALQKQKEFEYAGMGTCAPFERAGRVPTTQVEKLVQNQRKKAGMMQSLYGGEIYAGYESLLRSESIDAVYIPLPPALHFEWAMKAMQYGKHVLLEKPAVLTSHEMRQVVQMAGLKKLAVHENYMFEFHSQLREIKNLLQSGEIGEIRLYRMAFGFPMRAPGDFRYNEELGGGALNDAGGYAIKLASILLGDSARVTYAHLNQKDGFQVDLYGNGVMTNDAGEEAFMAFGMDNQYKCELEVWGSHGSLYTGRIFTAPPDFIPELLIKKQNGTESRKLEKDYAFLNSIHHFHTCITNETEREKQYHAMIRQAELVDEVRRLDRTRLTQ